MKADIRRDVDGSCGSGDDLMLRSSPVLHVFPSELWDVLPPAVVTLAELFMGVLFDRLVTSEGRQT